MTFGQQIKELHNSLGISLKSLSARPKIDRAYLSTVLISELREVERRERILMRLL